MQGGLEAKEKLQKQRQASRRQKEQEREEKKKEMKTNAKQVCWLSVRSLVNLITFD